MTEGTLALSRCASYGKKVAMLLNTVCNFIWFHRMATRLLQEEPLTLIIERNIHTSCRIFAQNPISPGTHYSLGSSGNRLSAWTNR